MEEYKKPLEEFIRLTTVPRVKIQAVPGKTSLTQSKFGGTPWLPEGISYPYSIHKNGDRIPLILLAQLNFAEMPAMPGFPKTGLLQFFIDGSDTLFGADFDRPTRQEGFRILYYPENPESVKGLQSPPAFTSEETEYFPVQTEHRLSFTAGNEAMGTMDFRFDRTFLPLYNRYNHTHFTESYQLEDTAYEKIDEALNAGGHKTGGYPFFTQSDPRNYDDPSKEYTILLLQIDSDKKIMWGDQGVANFFITPADLEKRDFSRVLYHWDCY